MNEDVRDMRLTLATALAATPSALLFGLAVARLLPMASPSRPELVLAAVLCLGVALLLVHAAALSWLALGTRLGFLPAAFRLLIGRIVLSIGSGAARRLVMRSASASALGLAALGVTGAAIASPLPAQAAPPSDSMSWVWGPTDRPSEGPEEPRARPGEHSPSSLEAAQSATGGGPAPEAPATVSTGAPAAEGGRGAPSDPGTGAAEESSSPSASPAPAARPPAPPSAPAATTRAPAATPEPPSGSARVTVLPGESLWSIAEALLPAGASDARIDASWRALYEANAAAIGPNPSLIRPGAVLSIPQELT